jgi:hypothetical protein
VTDDIIREIDEEVRRDRYVKLLKRYSTHITVVVVVIVLVFGGYAGWRKHMRDVAEAESRQFAQAMLLERSGKFKEAAEAFATLSTGGSSAYRALAGLQAAAARAAAGDVTAAVVEYDKLAADSGIPDRFRDLARLLAVQHLLDTAPPDDLEQRLTPLVAPDNMWRYSARELHGAVRLKAGDLAGARKAFAELSDDTTAPAQVRARAAEMLAALPGAS